MDATGVCVSCAHCLIFLGTPLELGSIRLFGFLVLVQTVYMSNFQVFGFDVVVLLCLDLGWFVRGVCIGTTSTTQKDGA